MNEIKHRLEALRYEMQKLGLDAFFISGTDPHSSEYLPDRWKTRAFISGFTGSYGWVVVTLEKAALWTDSRYFLQAGEQLTGSGIEMLKTRVPNAVSSEEWLKNTLLTGNKVGIDPQTMTVNGFRTLENSLAKNEIKLVKTFDLLDAIWDERPPNPSEKIFELSTAITGATRSAKNHQVVTRLKEFGADLQIVTMLDEVAWLFNLRGSDIEYNPVSTGFAVVGRESSFLFVEKTKLEIRLKEKLKADGVELVEYDNFYNWLGQLENQKIFFDPETVNYSVVEAIKQKNELIEGASVVSHLKAIKNKTELNGFREAMKKDGVALVQFLFWLKNNLGEKSLTEYSIGRRLAAFRSEQEGFRGESFPPIVGYKHHGAIVHLSADAENALPVEPEGILLFDSGGQYLQGTTDITRTVALGAVSEKQKKDFTLVLKGMIALSSIQFPAGTKGCHLDILARKALWENGLNYGHGTGHGVGHFLNVHEGPLSIRQEFNSVAIAPGMVTSNEPGLYREGEYGIRTENMMACVEKEETPFGKFLGFETLTLCPIDTSLIEMKLFTEQEKQWLNEYHKKVNKILKPLLPVDLQEFLNELTDEI